MKERLVSSQNFVSSALPLPTSHKHSENGELESKRNTANGEVTTYTYDVLGKLEKSCFA